MKNKVADADNFKLKLWRVLREKYLQRFTAVPASPIIFASSLTPKQVLAK